MPICVPSGLQTSVPGALQDEDPEAPAAGAAPEPPVAGAGGAAGAEPVEPEEPDELDDEALPGATAGPGAALGAAEATGGDTAGTLLEVEGEPEAEPAPAAKTPPEEEGLGAEAPDELPDEPDELEPPEAAPHLGPVGGMVLADWLWTDDPGFGNWTSPPSAVVQSDVGTLATNMSGNDVSRFVVWISSLFLEPPVTVTGAQFMYISRLPTLLNHVHARL